MIESTLYQNLMFAFKFAFILLVTLFSVQLLSALIAFFVLR